MCHVFHASLKGATLTWYGGLPPMSIDSFNNLVELFSAQYATSRSHRMTFASLVSLQQRDDESLHKFIDRFGRIVVQICNLNPEVALHSMLLVVRPGKFVDSLCKKPLVASTSCANEPKATSRRKKCPYSRMKSDKLYKSATRKKEAPRPTHASQTRGTSQTSPSLS